VVVCGARARGAGRLSSPPPRRLEAPCCACPEAEGGNVILAVRSVIAARVFVTASLPSRYSEHYLRHHTCLMFRLHCLPCVCTATTSMPRRC